MFFFAVFGYCRVTLSCVSLGPEASSLDADRSGQNSLRKFIAPMSRETRKKRQKPNAEFNA